MKIALVHDYIREFGGAERVLFELSKMYPKAPIYTAFVDKNSNAYKRFEGVKIIESFWGRLLSIWRLYSPLRFMIPWVWGGFDLSEYDLVIVSASWYITKGFRIGKNTKVLCYCHTPPRNLYGFQTSIKWHGLEWSKFGPAKIYAVVVNHFLRLFDFKTAQTPDRSGKTIYAGVDKFLANSENVKRRIEKFYRRSSTVVYPPVNVKEIVEVSKHIKKEDYFFIVSRIVDGKGLLEAATAANKLGFKLKIAGRGLGFSDIQSQLTNLGGRGVELLGEPTDKELWNLFAKAKGFIALAKDEDFGITPVEAMAAGAPVIAFNGGGFKESVVDGETGILIDGVDEKTIEVAVVRFLKTKWNRNKLVAQAMKFSISVFKRKIKSIVDKMVSDEK